MPVPLANIGAWSETRLTRFVEDWFRNHDLPATKAIQVDALTVGTKVVSVPADLATGAAQKFSGSLDAAGVTIGGAALPGTEIGYDQITANVAISGTTQAAPTTIIPGSSYSFDGAPVMVEFSAYSMILPSVAGAIVQLGLFEGATLIGIVGQATSPVSASNRGTGRGWLRFTPSSGAHTYSLNAWTTSVTGTPTVLAAGAGSGGSPAFLRFTKV